jgi:phage terminase small subunit
MRKLTSKQQRFVDEYLIDLNATQAAIRAGYSQKTANEQGARLLANASVQAAIVERIKARTERTKINADWVLRTLTEEATADLADLYDEAGNLKPVKDWPLVWRTGLVVGIESIEEFEGQGKERKFIGYTRKVKLSDRIKHKELIGKHVDVAAFRERHEITGKGGGPIQSQAVTPEQLAEAVRNVRDKF